MKGNETIQKDVSIRKAMQVLDISSKRVIFIEQDSKLIGVISDGDIRRWILKNGDLDECVDKAMNMNPIKMYTCDYDMAMDLMHKNDILAIPVVNEKDEIVEIYYWSDEEITQKKDSISASVVIMAGGKGERLLPYTSVVPKPLIPIGEQPIIERVIGSFRKYGCNEFFISVNYKKNMIKAYFEDTAKDYSISFIEEEKPLGTGGSLALLKGKLIDTFIVSNCDILLNTDYSEIYQYHKKHNNMITIVTSVKRHIIPYGIVNINDRGEVKNLVERPGYDHLVNTGVYILEPEVLNRLKDNEFIHITELIEQCIKDNQKVGTYPISEEAWLDMGQFEDMEKMKIKLQG